MPSKMKRLSTIVLCVAGFILLNSCMQFALRLSPSLFSNFTTSIFEECDPELAKDAIPANLKLMEGLLKNAPNNKQILTTLAMGFTGYSMLFAEEDDPERASMLYLRAKDYGIRALGNKASGLTNAQIRREELQSTLKAVGKEDLEALFWTTASWNAWISLNLDRPAALAQIGLAQACLERVLEIDPNYFKGLPYVLMGVSLSVRSFMLGGNAKEALEYFEKALHLTQGKFFLSQYYFARYYAVRIQDKELFLQLLEGIIHEDPHDLKDVCLMNAVIQQKAKHLREMVDEFFL